MISKSVKNYNEKYIQIIYIILLIVIFYLAEHSFFYTQRYEIPEASKLAESIKGGNIERQVAYLLLGLMGFIFLLFGNRKLAINGLLGWVILLYIAWSVFSVVWSDDIRFTGRKIVVMILYCLGAIGMARKFSARDIVLFTAISTGFYLFLGIFVDLYFGNPNIGEFYRFSGTIHPHSQSLNCGLLCIAVISILTSSDGKRWILILFVILSLLFLILTKDRTSFVSIMIILLSFSFYKLSLFEKRVMFVCAIIGISILFFLAGDLFFHGLKNPFLLGRASEEGYKTLTGRTELWQLALEHAKSKIYLGYGYDSFWTPVRAEIFTQTLGWPISEAHSLYVEMLLDGGIIGLSIYIIMFILAIKEVVVLIRQGNTAEIYFPLFLCMVIFFFLMTGINSSTSPRPTYIGFLVFVVLARIAFIKPILKYKYN